MWWYSSVILALRGLRIQGYPWVCIESKASPGYQNSLSQQPQTKQKVKNLQTHPGLCLALILYKVLKTEHRVVPRFDGLWTNVAGKWVDEGRRLNKSTAKHKQRSQDMIICFLHHVDSVFLGTERRHGGARGSGQNLGLVRYLRKICYW